MTADHELTAEQDMRARWLPTDTAARHAKALLDAEPRADLAVIPMVQPGKTVPGVVFIGVNSFEDTPDVPSFSWAREAAAKVARDALGDRPGTAASATVWRDGHVSVLEVILSDKAASLGSMREVTVRDGELRCPYCGSTEIREHDRAERGNRMSLDDDGLIVVHQGQADFETVGFFCNSCGWDLQLPDELRDKTVWT